MGVGVAGRAGGLSLLQARHRLPGRPGIVFVSVIGGDSEAEEKLQWLRRLAPAIREEVGKRIVLKFLPRFDYVLDRSHGRASRVLEILDQIDRPEKKPPAAS